VARKKPTAKAANGRHSTQHAIEQFLYQQADLLDSKRWADWIALFADDGVYWMPPDPSYSTWDGTPAIFAEDKNLMRVRMGRVLHPDAWSQRPLWGDDVRHFAGSYRHDLKKTKDGYRIKLQRVDMTNAQAAYDYVLQVWV
jgi:hypothetical protein